jgi:hypothetical protein
MSRELLLGMLRKGQTGNEILQILDVITSTENQEDEVQETAEV